MYSQIILQNYWIFTQQQLNQIHQYRNKTYFTQVQPNVGEDFDDRILQNFYLKNLIKLCRRRKGSQSNQLPFLIQKVTQSAVHIFKRYYLVNTFVDSNPEQNLFIAIYLAWKLEQMSENNIRQACQRMKNKDSCPKNILHYAMQGYTQLQMNFLVGINFSINKVSMVRCLQSLIVRIEAKARQFNKQERLQLQEIIDRIYFNQIFWTVHPAKLALCLGIMLIQKLNLSLQIIDKDEDIIKIIQQNKTQIDQLIIKVKGLKNYQHKDKKILQNVHKYEKLTRKFRKPTLKRMHTVNNISPQQK